MTTDEQTKQARDEVIVGDLPTSTEAQRIEAQVAFVRALGELANPARGSRAEVETKGGGSYGYSYAELDAILGLVRPILAAHGLAVSQPVRADADGLITVRTRLLHVGGGTIEGEPFARVVEGSVQQVGSFITYARRYQLVALLGIHPEGEDDDARAASNGGSAPTTGGLPDPVIAGLHLSERTPGMLQDLIAAPPSQRVKALAEAWLAKAEEPKDGSA